VGNNVTLRDIADALGISKATVSLVINKDPRVAKQTRINVINKIEELGYIYNRGAALLSTGRSNTIGLAVHDLANPYFTEVCMAIESVLSRNSKMSFLCNTNESLERQTRFIEEIIENRVDGLILCPADNTGIKNLKPIFDRKLATVLIARDIEDSNLDFVGNDGQLAIKLVTEHLIKLGHRRIAMVGGGQQTSASRSRRAGFYNGLKGHDMPIDTTLVLNCESTVKGGEEIIGRLMQTSSPPTAVVCFTDLIALGALSGLYHMGLVPGKDVAVVGCDDIEEASRGYVQLTTARIKKNEIGQRAAELLFERISNPQNPPKKIIMKPELIVRKTCGSITL
jgi:LacI family transcriptional regulator